MNELKDLIPKKDVKGGSGMATTPVGNLPPSNGTYRQSFWSFNAGHAILFVMMLGGFIWWFTNYDRGNVLNTEHIATISTNLNLLQARVQSMDEKGTQSSQRELIIEGQTNIQQNDRLKSLEENYRLLLEKVDSIDKNVQHLIDTSPKTSKP